MDRNETTRDRIRRERNERKASSDLREFARNATEQNNGFGSATYINADRRQEIETRVREQNAPVVGPHVRKASETLQSETSESTSHPFKLIAELDGATLKWKLSSAYSTILDGTNGTGVSITGLDTLRTTSGYVYIKIEIDVDLLVTSATVSVEASALDEVVFSGSDQTEANLLIGKVISEDSIFKFIQAIREAQILSTGLVNGSAARVFNAHPVLASSLTLPT